MDILNNINAIYYSEFLFKNYFKTWLKILSIDKNFLPYATSNLIRSGYDRNFLKNYILKFLIKDVNSNLQLTIDNIWLLKLLIYIYGKHDYNEIISKLVTLNTGFNPNDKDKMEFPLTYYQAILNFSYKYRENNIDYYYTLLYTGQRTDPELIVLIEQFNTNKDYYLIIYQAGMNNNSYFVELLINALVKNNLTDSIHKNFIPIINKAAKNNNLEMIKLLLPYNSNNYYKDAIHEAVKNNNLEIVKFLVQNYNNFDYKREIEQAVKNNNIEIIQYLESYNQNKNYLNAIKSTTNSNIVNLLVPLSRLSYPELIAYALNDDKPQILQLLEPYFTMRHYQEAKRHVGLEGREYIERMARNR